MKAMQGAVLGLAMAAGGMAGWAQDATIPMKQIERNARLSARAAVPNDEAAMSRSNGMFSAPSTSGSFVFVPPARERTRTLSPGFFAMNGLHLGMAVLDVEMTQHCIADHHCQEGNPLMPTSQAGQLGVNFALVGYGTFLSYELKRRDNKLWRLSPMVGIAAHTVGAATGFVHF